MRRKITGALAALALAGAGLGASARAASNRPLNPLSAATGATRHGPCVAGIGIVGDSGCPGGGRPNIAGCTVFPSDNAWNTDISNYPRHPNSDGYLAKIAASAQTPGESHAFLGVGAGGERTGMPVTVVGANEPLRNVTFTTYAALSPQGPFPIPLNAGIEPIGDAHVIVVQQGTCLDYELFNAHPSGNGWVAEGGGVFDLSTNERRAPHFGAADAAGLPILAGLVRYDEVATGAINHALRFTVRETAAGMIAPATHYAALGTGANRPPMGLRVRLRADFDRSRLDGQARVIADALAKYGAILADNGWNWIFYGDPSPYWDTDNLQQLYGIPGTAFEVVDTGPVTT